MGMLVHTGFWYDAWPEARGCVEAGLGDFVIGITNPEDAAFCRTKKVYFVIPDLRDHGTLKIPGYYMKDAKEEDMRAFTKNPAEQIRRIREAGGEFYAGLSTLHEYGGRVYWPRPYLEPVTADITRAREGDSLAVPPAKDVLKGKEVWMVNWTRPSLEPDTADSPRAKEGDYLVLPPARDLLEAKQAYMADLKRVVREEKANGGSPVMLLCASAFHKYHLEAGIDVPGLELFAADVYPHVAAIRGAAKAYGRKWCAGSAMVCQGGGASIEALWFKRHRLSLLYSYLAGADIVVTQYGAFDLWVRRDRKRLCYGPGSKKVQEHRRIAMEFYDFCQTHPRPEDGPRVTLGVIHGHLDGNAGLWTPWVWGQRSGDEWKHSEPEFGWDYLDGLCRRAGWDCRTLEGKTDFSGHPPYGQYDIVPIEVPLPSLKKYKCLMFLGWNTMTGEIYEKLKAFVKGGGHLIMAVPHLSTQTCRGKPIKLYKRGDYRDLFGVIVRGEGPRVTSGHKFLPPAYRSYRFPEWGVSDPLFINGEYPLARVELKGARVLCRSSCTYTTPERDESGPALVEHRLGKGAALLITSWCYPGHRGMAPLMKQLLRDIAIYEQGNIKLAGSDRIKYAVYEEKGLTTIYLLNTDFEVSAATNIWIRNKEISNVTIGACEMRIAYVHKECCLIPNDRSVHVVSMAKSRSGYEVVVTGKGRQEIDIHALTGRITEAMLNGKPTRILPTKEANGRTAHVKLTGTRDVLRLA